MIAGLKARLPKGMYGKSIAKLAVGTAIGQAIAIISSPVLTRIYTPQDFGMLAVYASIIGIVGSLAPFSYHQAIPLPEDSKDAANVFGLSLILVLVVAGLSALAVVLIGPRIASFLGVPGLAIYLWLVPLGVLGLAGYEVMNQWAVRQKAFSSIARTTISKGVLQTGAQLAYGFAAAGPFGLLLGQLLGQWAGIGGLLSNALRNDTGVLRGISRSEMKEAASRYSRFPKFTTPSILFNVAGRNTPALILSYFFGGAVAGFFALGERILMLPVTLLSKNASQVFVASAPDFYRNGRLGVEVEYLFQKLLRLGLTPVIILGISSPILFAFVFGDQWTESGHYVRWLSAWLLFVFLSFALAPVILVLERQKAGMMFQGVMAIGRIGSLIVGGLVGSALFAVGLFGTVSGLLWAIYLVWLLVVSGASIRRVLRSSIRELLACLPFVVPVLICVIFDAVELAVVGAASVGLIGAALWFLVRKEN